MKVATVLIILTIASLAFLACDDNGGGAEPTVGPTDTPDLPSGETVCDEPPIVSGRPADGNQFVNGSFEEGAEPWCSLNSAAWGDGFVVSSSQALDGSNSAYLAMRTGEIGTELSSRVFGLTTEVAPEEFPELLSGNYYIENWDPGTDKVYLQAVVVVWNATNLQGDFPNHQIRYVLGGIDQDPLEIGNAEYRYLDTGGFGGGRWVRFEANIRDDFEELWGAVPEGYDRIRVLFEVRWDDANFALDPATSGDVYYDDLYLGPASAAP